MSKTGQATASSSIPATVSIATVSPVARKAAVATAFPQTSCAQLTFAWGVTLSSKPVSRSSRLARPQHQRVRPERDRTAVAVCCLVPDAQADHRETTKRGPVDIRGGPLRYGWSDSQQWHRPAIVPCYLVDFPSFSKILCDAA
jgi:hypothetical protein